VGRLTRILRRQEERKVEAEHEKGGRQREEIQYENTRRAVRYRDAKAGQMAGKGRR